MHTVVVGDGHHRAAGHLIENSLRTIEAGFSPATHDRIARTGEISYLRIGRLTYQTEPFA
ncbi:hypothetical protein [Klebsiella variicola]|uniref:hypothetical protein n=1 Tax=Klebsiella variicola TaxID=244366 RepID=UPI001CDADFE6|nr:hypothetical protein [Klebsiella variicola]